MLSLPTLNSKKKHISSGEITEINLFLDKAIKAREFDNLDAQFYTLLEAKLDIQYTIINKRHGVSYDSFDVARRTFDRIAELEKEITSINNKLAEYVKKDKTLQKWVDEYEEKNEGAYGRYSRRY